MTCQDKLSTGKKSISETSDWMQQRWRPMMAMLYMAICAFDFIIFPMAWTAAQAAFDGGLTTQWQPLTLQGGGLIHVAFGAILGVSAWGRTQEKLAGVSNNSAIGTNTFTTKP
jgi:hypothetical protein